MQFDDDIQDKRNYQHGYKTNYYIDHKRLPPEEKEQLSRKLRHYLDLRFTIPTISNLLRVKPRAVKWIMEKNKWTSRRFDCMGEEELDSAVSGVLEMFPRSGATLVAGTLAHQNITVPRNQLRASCRRVKCQQGLPIAVPVRRRQYWVRAPMSLWHIDGHLKLVRWRFITHAGIDGFSRRVVFLQVSNNNKASTVVAKFRKAVEQLGLPARVRADCGTENSRVGRFMHAASLSTRPYLQGRSVHNQRIERLWKDYFEKCVGVFYHKFYEMEDEGILRPDSDVDIYCLHLSLVHLLPSTTEAWIATWNQHRLSSEHNKTPLQLFEEGSRLLQMQWEDNGGPIPLELLQDRQRIDEAGEISGQEFLENSAWPQGIIVPQYSSPLSAAEFDTLMSVFQPDHVTLHNLKEHYTFIRNYVIDALTRRNRI